MVNFIQTVILPHTQFGVRAFFSFFFVISCLNNDRIYSHSSWTWLQVTLNRERLIMDQILLQKIDLEIIRSTYCSFNQFQTQYSGLIQANHCTTSHMVHLMFCILIPFDHVLNNETNKTLHIISSNSSTSSTSSRKERKKKHG